MEKQTIQDSITELRAHLDANVAQVTPQERETLEALSARLELMMAEEREHWDENLVDELEKRVILYEEDHPMVARVIRQIISTLNNIGL